MTCKISAKFFDTHCNGKIIYITLKIWHFKLISIVLKRDINLVTY